MLPTICLYPPGHIDNRNKSMFVRPDPDMLRIQLGSSGSKLPLYNCEFVWAVIWYLKDNDVNIINTKRVMYEM